MRPVVQQERVYGIGIFGDDDVSFADGKLVDVGVRGAVAAGQVERVNGFVPGLPQPGDQPPRELGVNQRTSRQHRLKALDLAEPGGEGEDG